MQNTNTMRNFENEFQALLESWNVHQDLRENAAPLNDLLSSHQELSTRRLRTAHARSACTQA